MARPRRLTRRVLLRASACCCLGGLLPVAALTGCSVEPAVVWEKGNSICPYCRAPVADKSTACRYCGHTFRWVATICYYCNGTAKVTCPTCRGSGQRSEVCQNCEDGTIVASWRHGELEPRLRTLHLQTAFAKDGVGRQIDDVFQAQQQRLPPQQRFKLDPDEHVYECPSCKGTGRRVFQCADCSGTGKVKCLSCDATGKQGL